MVKGPKIYLIGASGTGKTTLAEYISIKHGFPVISGATRLAAKDLGVDFSLVTNQTCTMDAQVVDSFQKSVWNHQLELERPFWDSEESAFVSDRSFDLMAYTSGVSSVTWQIYRSKDLHDYLYRMRNPFVLVFFLRPNKKVKAKKDGRRDNFLTTEMTYRLDGVIEYILEGNEIPYVPITSPVFRDRMRTVDRLISAVQR